MIFWKNIIIFGIKFNDIWNGVSNTHKKELDCEPIYNKIFLKTKVRSYCDEATDSHARRIPGASSYYICWLVILSVMFLKKMKTIFCKCL